MLWELDAAEKIEKAGSAVDMQHCRWDIFSFAEIRISHCIDK